MHPLYFFSDVSVNPQLKVGFGAYLAVAQNHLESRQHNEITNGLRLRKFESTSSTTLELETLLWGLEELEMENSISSGGKLVICTDSQCIVGLPDRRKNLEQRKFIAKNSGSRLRNADLYHRFYRLHDKFEFEIIKIKGHSKIEKRDILHQTFSHVDQISRKALKIYLAKHY